MAYLCWMMIIHFGPQRTSGARGRPAKADKKPQITLRLDADIVVWLKSLGGGYNQRANAMLRLFRDNAGLFQK